MNIEQKRFSTYKEISILIILIPMLFIILDTIGRMNASINNKNFLEEIFNFAFIHREIIVKTVLLLLVVFIVSKIKIIKEKFILGDFKVIIGYTVLGVIGYKFFGSEYGLYKSLDIYIMSIIALFLVVSGINDMVSSVDSIDTTYEEKASFEKLIYSRIKCLGIAYFIIYVVLISIENIKTILTSSFIARMIEDYSQYYNNTARIISVLGIIIALVLIFMIRKSFHTLNLCYEEYNYIIKHKTFIEDIKKDINRINNRINSTNKYFNNKFRKLEDKKAQVFLKGMFDLFKDNKK